MTRPRDMSDERLAEELRRKATTGMIGMTQALALEAARRIDGQEVGGPVHLDHRRDDVPFETRGERTDEH